MRVPVLSLGLLAFASTALLPAQVLGPSAKTKPPSKPAMPLASAIARPTGWLWKQPEMRGDELWLKSTRDGVEMFEFRLGSAGTIAELNYCKQAQPLLMGADWDVQGVDRVMEWSVRATKKYDPAAPYSHAYDQTTFNSEYIVFERDSTYELNITQAGCMPPQSATPLAQTRRVVTSPSRVDIYAKCDRLWTADVQKIFDGTAMSALTRYDLLADGVLKVRQWVLVGEVVNRRELFDVAYGPLAYVSEAADLDQVLAAAQPAHDRQFMLYFENWLPFRATAALQEDAPVFDTLTLGLEPDGTAAPAKSSYYHFAEEVGKNIPSYSALHAEATPGYAVVHNRTLSAAGATWPVVGIVFGRKPAEIEAGAGAVADPNNYPGDGGKSGHCLNSWFWPDNWTRNEKGEINGLAPLTAQDVDRGIAVLPALEMQKIVSGSVVEFTYYLAPRDQMDAAFRLTLETLAAADAGARVYAPNKEFSDDDDQELNAIFEQLRVTAADPNAVIRTTNLAPLVAPVRTGPNPALEQAR